MVAATDAQDVVLTLLNANWVDANTNNLKPVFAASYQRDRVANVQRSFSVVLSSEIAHPVAESAIGGYDREDPVISLQVVTDGHNQTIAADRRQHALKLRDEVIRILRLNARNGSGHYGYFQVLKMQDLSDELTQVQKHVIDVRLTSRFNFYG